MSFETFYTISHRRRFKIDTQEKKAGILNLLIFQIFGRNDRRSEITLFRGSYRGRTILVVFRDRCPSEQPYISCRTFI